MQTIERERTHEEGKKVALHKRPFLAAKSYVTNADREIGQRHGKKAQNAVRVMSLALSLMTARGISETVNDVFTESKSEAAKSLAADTLSLPVSVGKLALDIIGWGTDEVGERVQFGSVSSRTSSNEIADNAITPSTPDATSPAIEGDPQSDRQYAEGNLADCDPSATPAYEEINLGETVYGLVLERNPNVTTREAALNIAFNEFMLLNPGISDASSIPEKTSVLIPTDCTQL